MSNLSQTDDSYWNSTTMNVEESELKPEWWEYGARSDDKGPKEREKDKWPRDSLEEAKEREPHRSDVTLCKFFVAGTSENGTVSLNPTADSVGPHGGGAVEKSNEKENLLKDKDNEKEKRSIKEEKLSRVFRIALTEFIKELLKPAWKDGRVKKEHYKLIVQKAVEKVIATMQKASVPQTKARTDQYLAYSKPKLEKLVQDYLEKFRKGSSLQS
ncbi:hypothetical protein ACFE04_018932 [Oxalis oulophora]